MTSQQLLRRGLIGAVLLAGAGATSPAMAGRCGHAYAVDAPTTLFKVASACNVSLAALKEANRGVNPSFVRPGEHLAVPDETDTPGEIPSVAAADVAPEADDGYAYAQDNATYYVSANDYDAHTHGHQHEREDYGYYSHYTRNDHYRHEVSAPQHGANQSTTNNANPYYYQASVANAPAQPVIDSRLSYQKQSAARIRSAGLSMSPLPNDAVFSSVAVSRPVVITPYSSAVQQPTATEVSTLMECAVLRRREDGKIAQVREFKPWPDGRETPANCMEVEAAAYSASTDMTKGAPLSFNPAGAPALDKTDPGAHRMFRGYVSAVEGQCASLHTPEGLLWRFNASDAGPLLLGKEATVWAGASGSDACGGLTMDRAVFAERVTP